jgi:hypothetical protein
MCRVPLTGSPIVVLVARGSLTPVAVLFCALSACSKLKRVSRSLVWSYHCFRDDRWCSFANSDHRRYLLNAYRVLLT